MLFAHWIKRYLMLNFAKTVISTPQYYLLLLLLQCHYHITKSICGRGFTATSLS